MLIQRDALWYGPSSTPEGSTPFSVPGSASGVRLNMSNTAFMLRMLDSGVGSLYISHLTLTSLPALPLSYRDRTSLPDMTGVSEPMYALPMWFVRVRDK